MRYFRAKALGVWTIALLAICGASPYLVSDVPAEGGVVAPSKATVKGDVQFQNVSQFLTTYCTDCHGSDLQEMDRAFHELTGVLETDEQIGMWEAIISQLQFGLMPPAEEEQPERRELQEVIGWISQELCQPGIESGWIEKIQQPEYGNLVDHETLFSGEITGPGWSVPRLWRINPNIHLGNYSMGDIYGADGQGGRFGRYHLGVSQPYALREIAGIRDYAANGHIDEPTLELLLLNANELISIQIGPSPEECEEMDREYLAAGGHPARKPSNRFIHPTVREIREIVYGEGPPTLEQMQGAINAQFNIALRRQPSEEEMARFVERLTQAVEEGGNREGIRAMLTALLLTPESIYRMELGLGEVDEHGRRRLAHDELAYAIGYALRDMGPDNELLTAAREGRLNTHDEIEEQVLRLLSPKSRRFPDRYVQYVNSNPRVRRFFQEFFGYTGAPDVFKDTSRFPRHRPGTLVASTDILIGEILQEDKDVFRELLTTNRTSIYIFQKDFRLTYLSYNVTRDEVNSYIGSVGVSNAISALETARNNAVQATENLKSRNLAAAENPDDARAATNAQNAQTQLDNANQAIVVAETDLNNKRNHAEQLAARLEAAPPTGNPHQENFMQFGGEGMFELSADQRCGILTQPSWLVAHSGNFDNDPVKRGHWIYQRLLAGVVPDTPITVDATVPKDPHSALRERYTKTEVDYCWRCHQRMNPLGMAFEMYDDFGRFRTEEILGDETTIPVDAHGSIPEVGAPELAGEVTDAIDLMHQLADSDRARQSIIRHAFRFWIGRNETLQDSPTLIAADKAYVESGGSMKALIVSLLTSDPFLYRKDE